MRFQPIQLKEVLIDLARNVYQNEKGVVSLLSIFELVPFFIARSAVVSTCKSDSISYIFNCETAK